MNRWTTEELKILKKHYAAKGAKYVSERTGHPIPSVVVKAKTVGVRSAFIRRWKEWEINYLRRSYLNKPIESISRTLKRTPSSVFNKARLLELFVAKPNKWSKEDANLLADMALFVISR